MYPPMNWLEYLNLAGRESNANLITSNLSNLFPHIYSMNKSHDLMKSDKFCMPILIFVEQISSEC